MVYSMGFTSPHCSWIMLDPISPRVPGDTVFCDGHRVVVWSTDHQTNNCKSPTKSFMPDIGRFQSHCSERSPMP